MKISACNAWRGKVMNVIEGLVNDEVVVELPGGQEVVAVVTKTSVKNLGLGQGKDVFAVIQGQQRDACRGIGSIIIPSAKRKRGQVVAALACASG